LRRTAKARDRALADGSRWLVDDAPEADIVRGLMMQRVRDDILDLHAVVEARPPTPEGIPRASHFFSTRL
jgi:hypothetical protein